MNKKNFILLDVMKTGCWQQFKNFIDLNTMFHEKITVSHEIYEIMPKLIKNYDRKLAILDLPGISSYKGNEKFINDLKNRLSFLTNLGFKIILACPWESLENIQKIYKFEKILLKDIHFQVWPGYINWFWFMMYEKFKNVKNIFNHDNKKYDFLYLNKQSRPHRKKLFDALKKEQLLDNSLFSFLSPPYQLKLSATYELPWVDADNYPRYGSDQDIHEPQFNDCAFNLVSETNDNNHDVFITEKLWKPIIAQQIFVVHGNFAYLKKLREMGFRTFDSVFDESYDQEPDPDKRIDKIVSLCRYLRTVDKSKIYRETQSIRQHNYNKFFDKTALSNSINETVLGFLKFADRS